MNENFFKKIIMKLAGADPDEFEEAKKEAAKAEDWWQKNKNKKVTYNGEEMSIDDVLSKITGY